MPGILRRREGVAFPLAVGAAVIDLDGTLLDTATDLANGANAMLRELGLGELPAETIKSFIGKGLQNLVRRCLETSTGADPDASTLERAMQTYYGCYAAVLTQTTRPYAGVVEGLEALRAMEMPLGCITNKAERFTLPLLEATGLAPFFRLVICGDTLPKRKPDPLPLLHACKHFGVEPMQLVLVGDSLNDVQAARAAGCPVLCVPYGYNEGRDVQELDCDAIVSTLLEAASLVRRVQT